MSSQFVIVARDSVEEVYYDEDEIVGLRLTVVAGPFDDPHEAGFAARDHWSYEMVEIDP